MTDNNPVLYLDFDGVLHPWPVYRTADGRLELRAEGKLFMYEPLLEQLLQPVLPELHIILSPLWVANQGIQAVQSYLSTSLRHRVVGSTWEPDIEELDELSWRRLPRYWQICRHAERHGIVRWLALDDNYSGWPEDECERLVLCDGMQGLGDPACQVQLLERLEKLI